MHRVVLGESGLSVSPVAFGTWQLSPRFWGEQSKEDAQAAMKLAFDEGINFFDTADAYGDGLGETLNKVSSRLTTVELVSLNKFVGIDGEDPETVAAEWLKAIGVTS